MLSPMRAAAYSGNASSCRPASAMRWPSTGPSAFANTRSTNHGNVSASPFNVAANAGSPWLVTNSSQRRGFARNEGSPTGDTSSLRSGGSASEADATLPVASIRIVVATGPTAIAKARPACAARHACAHASRSSARLTSADGRAAASKPNGRIRSMRVAGCQPGATRTSRRPASSGSTLRRMRRAPHRLRAACP